MICGNVELIDRHTAPAQTRNLMTGLRSVFADLGSNSDECVAKPNIDSGDRILIFMDVSPPTEACI